MAEENTIKLHIGGMTCLHCQEKIETGLLSLEGVTGAEVNYSTGLAQVVCAESVTREILCKKVEELGYRILPEESGKKFNFYPLVILIAIVAVFVPMQYFGVLNYLAPGKLADSEMGYGMLFVIGLITGVHCIAMCGGINLSQNIPTTVEEGQKGFKTFIPTVFYNIGRVFSYTVLGLVFGTVGYLAGGTADGGIPIIIQGFVKIIAGILMVLMGVNMLGLIPVLRKFTPKIPKFISRRVSSGLARASSPFLVGVLNGLMPCGPLQSMWFVALATGTPWGGALAMFVFSIGTVPLMLGFGGVVAKLGQKFNKIVTVVGAALVVVMGLAMLSQGGSLTGFISPIILSAVILTLIAVGTVLSLTVIDRKFAIIKRMAAFILIVAVGIGIYFYANSPQVNGRFTAAVMGDGVQTVECELESGNYPNITVQCNVPVKWIIIADEYSINGCNNRFIASEFGIEYTFHEGENIIEFTPTKSGVFEYSCWMGMIHGKINVR